MTSDRVRIWKFSEAPVELQAMSQDSQKPEWVALVPKSLYGPDLEEAFRERARTRTIVRYESPVGDIVLMGVSPIMELVEVLATDTMPEAGPE